MIFAVHLIDIQQLQCLKQSQSVHICAWSPFFHGNISIDVTFVLALGKCQIVHGMVPSALFFGSSSWVHAVQKGIAGNKDISMGEQIKGIHEDPSIAKDRDGRDNCSSSCIPLPECHADSPPRSVGVPE